MEIRVTSLQRVFSRLTVLLPMLNENEQRIGLELYRQLSYGKPVPPTQLAQSLGVPTRRLEPCLASSAFQSLVYYDDAGLIVGFGGLAVVPMKHRFTVGGIDLYTWCAWDALFLPELLECAATIASTCPQTEREIRIEIDSEGIRSLSPSGTTLSFVLSDTALTAQSTAETIDSFCRHVVFLASRDAGISWTARRQGTFLLTLEDGLRLARWNNRARFGLAHPRFRRAGRGSSRASV